MKRIISILLTFAIAFSCLSSFKLVNAAKNTATTEGARETLSWSLSLNKQKLNKSDNSYKTVFVGDEIIINYKEALGDVSGFSVKSNKSKIASPTKSSQSKTEEYIEGTISYKIKNTGDFKLTVCNTKDGKKIKNYYYFKAAKPVFIVNGKRYANKSYFTPRTKTITISLKSSLAKSKVTWSTSDKTQASITSTKGNNNETITLKYKDTKDVTVKASVNNKKYILYLSVYDVIEID